MKELKKNNETYFIYLREAAFTLLKKNKEHFLDAKIGLQTAVTCRKIIVDKKLKKHFNA